MIIGRASSVHTTQRSCSRAVTAPLTVAVWLSAWLVLSSAVWAAEESQTREETEPHTAAHDGDESLADLQLRFATEEYQRWIARRIESDKRAEQDFNRLLNAAAPAENTSLADPELRALAEESQRWFRQDAEQCLSRLLTWSPSAPDPDVPTYKYVKFIGNRAIDTRILQQDIWPVQAGYPRDTYGAELRCIGIERLYHRRGYNEVRVTILEGDKLDDIGVVYRIDEGPLQRIRRIDFAGNARVADDELRQEIESKPAFLWIIPGLVEPEEIEEDVDRLTHHYRCLGYFNARIRQEVSFDDNRQWAEVTFVIDEGPRYRVRNLSLVGNVKFSTEQLMRDLKLKAGRHFNRAEMESDRLAIKDKYGSAGYLFADVEIEVQFLPEPHALALTCKIQEGSRCRVGRIRAPVTIDRSDPRFPAMKDHVIERVAKCVSECVSFRPGDIADIREIRASEQRLRSSGWFRIEPLWGEAPKIAFCPPDSSTSPSDNGSGDIPVDFEIRGELIQPRQGRASTLLDVAFTALIHAWLDRAVKRPF